MALFPKNGKYREAKIIGSRSTGPRDSLERSSTSLRRDSGTKTFWAMGDFGRVYRGVVPGSGQEVAVKSITKEFTEGMKEFVAEISSLDHRATCCWIRSPLGGWVTSTLHGCMVTAISLT